jgi:hypothetical protein
MLSLSNAGKDSPYPLNYLRDYYLNQFFANEHYLAIFGAAGGIGKGGVGNFISGGFE